MSPDSTNYLQETVESYLYWLTLNTSESYLLAYGVFGDHYVGANDFSTLYCITDPVALCGCFPGPGDFDN